MFLKYETTISDRYIAICIKIQDVPDSDVTRGSGTHFRN